MRTAGDSEEALRILEIFLPRFILMDIRPPDVTSHA